MLRRELHKPLIIGHRGASAEAPENTLPAFRLAREEGADGIEADFRLTADKKIVCMHDESTARTAGASLDVAKSSLKELRKLDAGAWRGSKWRGAQIPTLVEIIAELPVESWFFIELKSGVEIVAPLARILGQGHLSPDRTRLLSFDATVIAELRRTLPEWPACWLCEYTRNRHNCWVPGVADILATLCRTSASGLASECRSPLDRTMAAAVRAYGGELHSWTVDKPATARRLISLGIDSLITNRPGRLRQQLAKCGISP